MGQVGTHACTAPVGLQMVTSNQIIMLANVFINPANSLMCNLNLNHVKIEPFKPIKDVCFIIYFMEQPVKKSSHSLQIEIISWSA